MDFKEYDDIIKTHKYDMLYFIIYYNLYVNEDLQLNYHNKESENIQKQIKKLIYMIYDAYMKDETGTDLSRICDVAVKYKNEILHDKMNKWELLEKSVMIF